MLLIIILGMVLVIYIMARLTLRINRSNTCLVGKTAIVTGANSGIGFETTLNLASRGCRVIMADVADMQKSKRLVVERTNNPNIITKFIDLSSLKSVRQFASEILATEQRLDILINNAGIGISYGPPTEDGLNVVMQINYFSHFLLSHLLLSLLKKSSPSRIVFTSSFLAFLNNLRLDNFNYPPSKQTYFPNLLIYGNSKLAIIIATYIFGQRLKGTGVSCHCVHPGLVATPIYDSIHDYYVLSEIVQSLIKLFSKDAWEGSQALIHAAVSKELEGQTGLYLCEFKPFLKPGLAYDKKFCQKIWEASENYVGLQPEERLPVPS